MEKLLRFLRGYVRIRMTCEKPERFLKLCAHHGIHLSYIRALEDGFEMEMDCRDFFRLRPVCRKSHAKVHIIQKFGMPFFFSSHRKKKAFFVGFLLAFLLLYLCSTRIWNIHVEGNYSYSTESILRYLKEEKIVHGAARSDLNCSQIAASLRQHFPEITWVSARIKGTRLLITIQENMDLMDIVANEEETEAFDLVAQQNGRIVRMITRKGTPMLKEGDRCQKGDILVSGYVEIKNDSDEIVRYQAVTADADVYIQYNLSYYDEFSLKVPGKIYDGKIRKKLFLQAGKYRADIGFSLKSENREVFARFFPFRITENYILPITVGIMVEKGYHPEMQKYSETQAKAKAEANILDFFHQLSEKGVKISENNVKIAINKNTCISRGTITVIEKTGASVSAKTMQVQEEERTPMNEQ